MEKDTLWKSDKTLATSGKRPWPLLITVVAVAVVAGGFFLYLQLQPPKPPSQPGEEAYEPPAGMLHAGDKTFDWYRDFFKIVDPKAKLAFNYSGERMVFVHGNFENRGERSVDAAEVRIAFYDPQGQVIREKVSAPLHPELGLRKAMSSLEIRNFSVRFDNMPVDLKVGRLEVELVGLRLVPRKQG